LLKPEGECNSALCSCCNF